MLSTLLRAQALSLPFVQCCQNFTQEPLFSWNNQDIHLREIWPEKKWKVDIFPFNGMVYLGWERKAQ